MATDEKRVKFAEASAAVGAGAGGTAEEEEGDGLAVQDISKLDLSQLTPLTPEVISRQATINIGTIGHVAHGKTTLVKAISGVKTIRFKNELVRNITIKLGYANAKIYRSDKAPYVYEAQGSSCQDDYELADGSGRQMKLVRHVSFVDCVAEDHQLLTDRGFMFLSDIESLSTQDRQALRFAGYKEDTQELVYETPLKLVVKEAAVKQSMIELTASTPASATARSSSAKDSNNVSFNSNNNTSSMVSLVVTPGHDLYVRQPGEMVQDATTSRAGDGFEKRKARTLVRGSKQQQKAEKHEQQLVQLIANAKAGVSQAGENEIKVLEDLSNLLGLGLVTCDSSKLKAFMEVYGFWLHNSEKELGLQTTSDSEPVKNVEMFASSSDLDWLQDRFASCSLVKDVDYSVTKQNGDDNAEIVVITEPRWTAFFASQKRSASAAKQVVASWVWQLSKQYCLAILAGLSFASSMNSSTTTFSTFLRDEIVRVALHAGQCAYFSLSSSNDWQVTWSEEESQVHPTLVISQGGDEPVVVGSSEQIKEIAYSGRTWCASMPHGFVVARRAIVDPQTKQITMASKPIVMGNCPGHDILMATMLNGAAVMDAALLLIAGNEPCPQPQTSEHLAAVEIMQLPNIIILQNKIDLVKEEAARLQHDQIRAFVAGTVAGKAPIIPISAQSKYNIDLVCKNIIARVPIPPRDFTSSPRMIVIRSFDVNKPGEEASKLRGGVAGGSILQGVLKVGDEVEIRPGIITRDSAGRVRCSLIYSKIVTLQAEKNDLRYAVPGGLIGVGLQVDPTLTRADRLVGQVLGHKGSLPDIFYEIDVSFSLLRRLLGVKTQEGNKAAKVTKLAKGEMLMVNIGSTSSGGKVVGVKDERARIQLTQPVCTKESEKVALSRRVEGHWRLIGWGLITQGTRLVQGADGAFVQPVPVKTAATTAVAGGDGEAAPVAE